MKFDKFEVVKRSFDLVCPTALVAPNYYRKMPIEYDILIHDMVRTNLEELIEKDIKESIQKQHSDWWNY